MNGHGDESESQKFREGLWLSLEGRVRKVEGDVRELKTELKTELKHLATKKNTEETKTWMLRWLIGGLVAAGVAIFASLIRTFVN